MTFMSQNKLKEGGVFFFRFFYRPAASLRREKPELGPHAGVYSPRFKRFTQLGFHRSGISQVNSCSSPGAP